ncbi:unnamed protein product [Spirodela intermedia]|uniref:Uncharacterized protein n=1 Tax=Spirodela intermedia TaxID=51605 RepID=A0A7I8KQU7_SPIIN|nr:unnamed protein product [Spirodela intermedia]
MQASYPHPSFGSSSSPADVGGAAAAAGGETIFLRYPETVLERTRRVSPRPADLHRRGRQVQSREAKGNARRGHDLVHGHPRFRRVYRAADYAPQEIPRDGGLFHLLQVSYTGDVGDGFGGGSAVIASNSGFTPGGVVGIYGGCGGAVTTGNSVFTPMGGVEMYNGGGNGGVMGVNGGYTQGGAMVFYDGGGDRAAMIGNSCFTSGGVDGIYDSCCSGAVTAGSSGFTAGGAFGAYDGNVDFPPGCGVVAGIHGEAANAPGGGFITSDHHLYGGGEIMAAPQDWGTLPCYPRQMTMDGGAAGISNWGFVGE